MINSAGAGFLGRSVADVLGKDDTPAIHSGNWVGFVMGGATEPWCSPVAGTNIRGNRRLRAGCHAGSTSRRKVHIEDPSGPSDWLARHLVATSQTAKRAEEKGNPAIATEAPASTSKHTPLAVVEMGRRVSCCRWESFRRERIFGYRREERSGWGSMRVSSCPTQFRQPTWIRFGTVCLRQGGRRAQPPTTMSPKAGRTISLRVGNNTPLVDDSGAGAGSGLR